MRSNQALIILDTQVNMFAEDFSVYQGERILSTLQDMLARARP